MLYGEVFANEIDPKCGGPKEKPCITGKSSFICIVIVVVCHMKLRLINPFPSNPHTIFTLRNDFNYDAFFSGLSLSLSLSHLFSDSIQ